MGRCAVFTMVEVMLMEYDKELLPVEIETLKTLHGRFGSEIKGFIQALQTLCDEQDADALNLMFRIVTAALGQHIARIQKENCEWMNHVEGNA
jgi:hypothetical protein